MHNRGWIVGGLVVFLVLITFPVWYNLAGGPAAGPPDIRLPAGEKECVAPTEYMRTTHMDLLIQWRDEVVRNNRRDYTAFNGRTFNMSLTGTCLKQCHTSKADFCDRCHNYSGVKSPYCWDCHVDPATVEPASQAALRSGIEVGHE
ncbi:MAG: cytochrome C [Acidobacteria bacterium]|nr:cytochrome C [Acidobacteriota bacterium]